MSVLWYTMSALHRILVRDKDMLYINQAVKKINMCQLKQLADSTHRAHNKHTVNSYGTQHDEYYIKRGYVQ